MADSKGWHSRGYLPHFDSPEAIQIVTFRQADSLPLEQVAAWNQLLKSGKSMSPDERRKLAKLVDNYLDAGSGSSVLGQPEPAILMENAMLHFHGDRYELHAWVVMPNHVHALLEPMDGHTLPKIMHSWKSFTGHLLQKLVPGDGEFWQGDYFDRFIRSEEHFHRAVHYIESNPVKAGLCPSPRDWPYSSARRKP